MAKVRYVPAEGFDRVSVNVGSSDAVVVAEKDKPFETDDVTLQAELDTVDTLVRAGKAPAKAEG